ncbi:uncharacterized protein BDZ99DRAFT_567843 [Mytilinidion resinicola]|uniref:Uncharacterized protein n=1 Tax=Mytilinidion resinicola TaxID=574789 RepID=A0A6A6Z1L3_9PEZI|nr:uncharacterized protein BDZ99DRAFT_567843 [Mytilinidion resinicola]KAF2814174.1 hypothetical protein BDZ99DRAFT_567843 [Mytilinidion resinicola]
MTDINTWRKKIAHPTRSKTPVADDGDDRHSDNGSERSTSRLRPRPKLTRYLSNYLAISAPQKSDELFSDNFWDNLGQPADVEPKVDPYMVVQSISTMLLRNPNKPLPVAHNSGLLHLIENYRNLREEKEKLDELLKETLDGFKEAEERWATEEHNFRSEIRRLELIIARGKQGMTELMRARQGSVIHRKRKVHKTQSEEQLETAYEFLWRDQVNQDFLREGQRVVLRSKSPSNQMKALSRTLSHMNVHDDLPVGTPPDKRHKHSLSYWTKSNEVAPSHGESMLPSQGGGALKTSQSDDPSDTYSTFSSAGDALPDEEGATTNTILDARAEGEDFVALRDLVIQLARRRGICIETMLPRLVDIFEGKDDTMLKQQFSEASSKPRQDTDSGDWGLERRPRHSQSQPQLSSDRHPRRHFSFDPGDDMTISAMDQVAAEFANPGSNVQASSYSQAQKLSSQAPLAVDTITSPETRKPSMIPTPLQEHPLARVRREDSPSSILTSVYEDSLTRRDSASSVNSSATALRHGSSIKSSRRFSVGPGSSTSVGARSGTPRSIEHTANARNSFALAAARAAGGGSGQSSGTESSVTTKSRYKQHSNTGSRNSSSSHLPTQKNLHGNQPQDGCLGC